MNRYALWDKQTNVITPSGEIFTPAQWVGRYPVAALDGVEIVCAKGVLNGGFFGVLDQMVVMYEAQGCDFSLCVTAEDKLNAIEAFEDQRSEEADELVQAERIAGIINNQRIADALEDLVVLSMPDVE